MYEDAYPPMYDSNDPLYPPAYGLVTVIPVDLEHTPGRIGWRLRVDGERLLEEVLELARARGWAGVTREDALEACRARARAAWPDAERNPAERYDPWVDAWPWEAQARRVAKIRRPGAAGRSLAYSAALKGAASSGSGQR